MNLTDVRIDEGIIAREVKQLADKLKEHYLEQGHDKNFKIPVQFRADEREDVPVELMVAIMVTVSEFSIQSKLGGESKPLSILAEKCFQVIMDMVKHGEGYLKIGKNFQVLFDVRMTLGNKPLKQMGFGLLEVCFSEWRVEASIPVILQGDQQLISKRGLWYPLNQLVQCEKSRRTFEREEMGQQDGDDESAIEDESDDDTPQVDTVQTLTTFGGQETIDQTGEGSLISSSTIAKSESYSQGTYDMVLQMDNIESTDKLIIANAIANANLKVLLLQQLKQSTKINQNVLIQQDYRHMLKPIDDFG